ncbi:hypothetical protein EVAR_29951_1 [Eumeta japonica]|uniref:Uncharacterized protein n=1 Tax=Eumeta variegata TaxID=151549 RepID=A0A4C1VGK1_EUMVA|nr:hypothetical protein EVAR_29951_1 [Eumeta japonica]
MDDSGRFIATRSRRIAISTLSIRSRLKTKYLLSKSWLSVIPFNSPVSVIPKFYRVRQEITHEACGGRTPAMEMMMMMMIFPANGKMMQTKGRNEVYQFFGTFPILQALVKEAKQQASADPHRYNQELFCP